MPSQSGTLREWISRLLAGAAFGSVLLVLLTLLIRFVWLGPHIKGLHMWVLRIPEYGLPAAIVLGGLAGLAWRRTRDMRLSRGWLIGACLVVALMAQHLRPQIAHIWHYGFGPLYEEVPDCLAIFFCLVGLLVLLFDRGPRPQEPKSETSAQAEEQAAASPVH